AQRAAMEGLGRLEGAGLVRRTPAGRAYLHELRRDHRLVRAGILPLLNLEAEIRSGVFARLREAFGKVAVSGCVFGSTARGEERPGSDLDILLIVDRKGEEDLLQKRASRLFEELRRELGIRPSLLVLTRGDLTRRHRSADEFARNVVREGETFAGRPMGTVIDD
ncbi:MAG: nucleotidyltransferase domain-containing protein, partial [Nitrospirae bacterium]|nr:nucleotidyltransferase domain-containing protein [Nitrospirota bacterium]